MRPAAVAGPVRIVSRRSGWRGLWGALGILVFGAATVASVAAFAQRPHVDSAVLVLITAPFLVMACVLAGEGVAQGVVRLDEDGYATPVGRRRAWRDVLAVGTGSVEGRDVPVVAVRTPAGIEQDVFSGFTDAEAARLLQAFGDRVEPAGFAGVELGTRWWATAEAEADRAASVVREATGRTPESRERVPFGYPGLASAIRLDYGANEAGEGVELLVRLDTDLALTAHGRRWLRQNRKRSGDAAADVARVFGPHTSEVVPARGAGFDRLVLRDAGRRPLHFNAEEPDRF